MSYATTLRLLLFLIALAAPVLARADQSSDVDLERRARTIHTHVLVLDSHVDVLLPSTDARYAAADGKSQAELDKLERGGIGAITLAIAVGPPLGAAGGPAPVFRDFVDHIDYVVKRVGFDHVGIGSSWHRRLRERGRRAERHARARAARLQRGADREDLERRLPTRVACGRRDRCA